MLENLFECNESEANWPALRFNNVIMNKDFGPLKKGQKIPILMFELDLGICEVLNDNEEVILKFKVELSPIANSEISQPPMVGKPQ